MPVVSFNENASRELIRLAFIRFCALFMVFASCLNCFRTVELLQYHDPGQMVGESHGAHGQLEIGALFHPGSHAEGGTNEKAGAGFACVFYILQLMGKIFTAQYFSFGGKYAEPGALGDF